MISVITAVHGQLPMNRLFEEFLRRNTRHPYELIIIDNASTDGSAEFFERRGARVIRNAHNYSYPYTQNQGLDAARFDHLVFMNNDILVPRGWDVWLLESAAANGLEILTGCGLERLETQAARLRLLRRWERIKRFGAPLRHSTLGLRAMHRLMYPDWEAFCRRRHRRFRHQVMEGFVGNTVYMTRSAIEKVGRWNERAQAGADFDLFCRSKVRAQEVGDIRPVHVALDVYLHHYIRLTAHSSPPAYHDASRAVHPDQIWADRVEEAHAWARATEPD